MVVGAELVLQAKEKVEFLSDKKRVDIDTTRKFKRHSSSLLTHVYTLCTLLTPLFLLSLSRDVFNFMSMTMQWRMFEETYIFQQKPISSLYNVKLKTMSKAGLHIIGAFKVVSRAFLEHLPKYAEYVLYTRWFGCKMKKEKEKKTRVLHKL